MTCGKLQVQSHGLLWLLCTVYVVKIALTPIVSVKRSTATSQLIVQRPRFAGDILTILLDSSVKLVRCSKHDLARHTIRLVHGPNGKRLAIRAPNAVERENWITVIQALSGDGENRTKASSSRSTKHTKHPERAQQNPTAQQPTDKYCHVSTEKAPSYQNNVNQVKQLASCYDDITRMYNELIAEQREFTVRVNSLHPSNERTGPAAVET